jgi:hypothetical protein
MTEKEKGEFGAVVDGTLPGYSSPPGVSPGDSKSGYPGGPPQVYPGAPPGYGVDPPSASGFGGGALGSEPLPIKGDYSPYPGSGQPWPGAAPYPYPQASSGQPVYKASLLDPTPPRVQEEDRIECCLIVVCVVWPMAGFCFFCGIREVSPRAARAYLFASSITTVLWLIFAVVFPVVLTVTE